MQHKSGEKNHQNEDENRSFIELNDFIMWHVIASIIGSVAMRIEEALSPSLKNESFSASMNKLLQKTHHRRFQKPYSPASHATLMSRSFTLRSQHINCSQWLIERDNNKKLCPDLLRNQRQSFQWRRRFCGIYNEISNLLKIINVT